MNLVEGNWQINELNAFAEFLKLQNNITSAILKGSLVNQDNDYWSDIDIIVLVTELNSDSDWLELYKQIFTLTSSISSEKVTHRVIFQDFSRIDLIQIKDSENKSNNTHSQPTSKSNLKLLFTKNKLINIENLNLREDVKPSSNISKDLINGFWFKATLAVNKVMRNDMLIANHLLLDLYREYLVVLMIMRDKDLGTSHHRFGGKYNEYVQALSITNLDTKVSVLELINSICEMFDKLVYVTEPDLSGKYIIFRSFLEKAKQEANK